MHINLNINTVLIRWISSKHEVNLFKLQKKKRKKLIRSISIKLFKQMTVKLVTNSRNSRLG